MSFLEPKDLQPQEPEPQLLQLPQILYCFRLFGPIYSKPQWQNFTICINDVDDNKPRLFIFNILFSIFWFSYSRKNNLCKIKRNYKASLSILELLGATCPPFLGPSFDLVPHFVLVLSYVTNIVTNISEGVNNIVQYLYLFCLGYL